MTKRLLLTAVALVTLSSFAASAVTSISNADLEATGATEKSRAKDVPDAAIWSEPAPTSTPPQLVTAPAPPAAAPAPALSDNPLWAVPLATLSATRERPIFSPSRRPPAPPAAPVAVQRVAPPPKPKEPERPQLALVGTIASANEGFGIFLDVLTKTALRLKIGEVYQGWRLRSVQGREVVLEKDETAATLAMPKPGEERADAEPATGSTRRSSLQSVGRGDR